MKILLKKADKKPRFSTGEIVQIKTIDEILKTVDPIMNTLEGCLFTRQMQGYCGSRYEIFKIVKSYFDENKQRTFETKSTLYILKKLICDGNVEDFPHKCDRSCFLLWHEDWLEKVP